MNDATKNEGDDHEFVWAQDPFSRTDSFHLGLKDLDQAMRCQICCNFYRAPVSVPSCHHTFCSECLSGHVRAGLTSAKRSASCPICRQQIVPNASNIRNRTVEDIVRKFTQIRSSLLVALKRAEKGETSAIEDVEVDEDEKTPTSLPRSRSSRRKVCVSSGTCTGQEENGKDILNCDTVIKKLPKIVYHGLKKKQLQKKCQELGLNTDGDESQLKARHQEYVRLHNAQCDSFHPRPKAELIKEVQERERAKKKIAREERMSDVGTEKQRWNHLIKSRSEEGATISSGDPSFDAKVESNFARMMRELRAKRESSKPPTANSGGKDETQHQINQLGKERTKKAFVDAGEEGDSIQKIPKRKPSPTCLEKEIDETSDDSSVVVVIPQKQRASPSLIPQLSENRLKQSTNVILPSPRTNAAIAENASGKKATLQENSKERKTRTFAQGTTTPRSKRRSVGPWDCTHCTFHNKTRTWSTARCEMCSFVRT
mmetsp:Transcript_13538/g.19977  ORF Transcript_13538/g.19977 Transcript_13538/m.19977 type:complete len:485 (+) Transcript_13538:135-1589(+)|eukprot:CAMPEP_0194207008 /NCGR_PEP_ID=MMETSP0156-20130528/5887_1 /TAXON_ID=33649 /ORGANISM="Thalassionema nitzschioides, Strain L26-B" /LENGTH=484 /DNA_ID=CAMNT_0038933677 /DNA_START=55 /DNA_END=1509 /DNA_ORIENTATION=+